MFDFNAPITPEEQAEIDKNLQYVIFKAAEGVARGRSLDAIARDLNIHAEFLEILPSTFPDTWKLALTFAQEDLEREQKAAEPVKTAKVEDNDWYSMVG